VALARFAARAWEARAAGEDGLRKKAERKQMQQRMDWQGLKARVILLAVSARLKPCPCYKARLAARAGRPALQRLGDLLPPTLRPAVRAPTLACAFA